jgi:hypothetical protein
MNDSERYHFRVRSVIKIDVHSSTDTDIQVTKNKQTTGWPSRSQTFQTAENFGERRPPGGWMIEYSSREQESTATLVCMISIVKRINAMLIVHASRSIESCSFAQVT